MSRMTATLPTFSVTGEDVDGCAHMYVTAHTCTFGDHKCKSAVFVIHERANMYHKIALFKRFPHKVTILINSSIYLMINIR